MTKKVRLVHTADLHLGTSFSALPDLAASLRQEQMQLFLRIIEYCRQNQADILLVAGDMFEQPIPEQALVRNVQDAFRLIPETKIFITPGNHDPVGPDSPWSDDSWPENVHVFRSGLEKIELNDLDVCVFGAAFYSTAAVEPLVAREDPQLDMTRINILIMHGELVGSGQSSVYNPVDRSWLGQSGFDYVALGHVHLGHARPEKIAQGNTLFAYSGCPAGRGFDEEGERGIISGDLIKVEQPGLTGRGFRVDHDLRRVHITSRQFKVLDIDISSCQNQDEIYFAIRDGLEQSGNEWQQDLYKLILIGALDDDIQPAPAVLLSRLRQEIFFCKIIDKTTRIYNLAALAGEHSLMGAFVRRVLAQDEPDWNKLSHEKTIILQTGLQAFEGEVIYREAD